MKLIFIRHGDPDYVHDGLTEKGKREAALLAERVKGWEITALYCSPLGRARETAAVSLAKLNGRTATTCEWLREFFAPVNDPKTGEKRIPWDLMPGYYTKEALLYEKDGWYKTPLMRTGAVEEEYKRVCGGFDGLLAEYGYVREGGLYKVKETSDATLVFFCHLGVTCVLLAHLLGVAPPLLWQGCFLAPTSVTMLQTQEREAGEAIFRCRFMGDTAHLFMGGEPVSDSGFFA